jgi:uncharacterized C2H2 Zn-finger protein
LQSLFAQTRLDKLFKYYEEEYNRFYFDLHDSKTKEDKKLLKKIDQNKTDKGLGKKLLRLYLDRCKFKHALAFMQFRRILPDAAVDQLKEIFNDRKEYIKRVNKKVSDMIA